MKIDRPLINPSPYEGFEDYKNEDIDQVDFDEPVVEPTVHSEDQLNLNIDTPKVSLMQRLNSFRMYLEKRNQLLEISALWKSPALPFTIVSTIFNLLLLISGTILLFEKIPPQVPIFYNSIDKRWEQVDKTGIIFISGFLVIVETLIIYFIMKTFKSDKRLALTVSWMVFILNILILIAIIQIYSLII
jgi:hypothetical protein